MLYLLGAVGLALVGGVTATVLYGAMAAAIVVLLTLEAAALILLLGGEVIAEIDRSRAGTRSLSK